MQPVTPLTLHTAVLVVDPDGCLVGELVLDGFVAFVAVLADALAVPVVLLAPAAGLVSLLRRPDLNLAAAAFGRLADELVDLLPAAGLVGHGLKLNVLLAILALRCTRVAQAGPLTLLVLYELLTHSHIAVSTDRSLAAQFPIVFAILC